MSGIHSDVNSLTTDAERVTSDLWNLQVIRALGSKMGPVSQLTLVTRRAKNTEAFRFIADIRIDEKEQ